MSQDDDPFLFIALLNLLKAGQRLLLRGAGDFFRHDALMSEWFYLSPRHTPLPVIKKITSNNKKMMGYKKGY
jgi:hypothetical protein